MARVTHVDIEVAVQTLAEKTGLDVAIAPLYDDGDRRIRVRIAGKEPDGVTRAMSLTGTRPAVLRDINNVWKFWNIVRNVQAVYS